MENTPLTLFLWQCNCCVSPQGAQRSCWCLEQGSWRWEQPVPCPSVRSWGRSTLKQPVNSTRSKLCHHSTHTGLYEPQHHLLATWHPLTFNSCVSSAGEDRCGRGLSRADGSWVPEPPGAGGVCGQAGGEEELFPHRLQRQDYWRPESLDPKDPQSLWSNHGWLRAPGSALIFSLSQMLLFFYSVSLFWVLFVIVSWFWIKTLDIPFISDKEK